MSMVKDSQWLRQAFMLPTSNMSDNLATKASISISDNRHRTYSGAEGKYTDTTLGGNFTINNVPQATRFTDRKQAGMHGTKGMGRYYSEAYDDNAVRCHLRFGVPEYNSISTFFANFYDPEAGQLARTGETRGIFNMAGRAVGFLVSVPLKPFVWAGRFWRFATNKPYSKYYYLKSTMPLYWQTATNIVNTLAVNSGLSPSVFSDETTVTETLDDGTTTLRPNYSASGISSEEEWKKYQALLPKIFTSQGGVNLYAVATGAQRRHNSYLKHMENVMMTSDKTNIRDNLADLHAGNWDAKSKHASYADYIGGYLSDSKARMAKESEESSLFTDSVLGSWDKQSLGEEVLAGLRDGAEWVAFRLDEPPTASESFTSTTKESSIAETINGVSAQAKEAKNSFMNFNIGDGPVSSVIEGFTSAVGDFVSGVGEGVGLSGLAVLGGGAFADIPQVWEDSSASLPSADFTIQLRTPYGNKLSIFQNLYVPLAMLLAGALPLSTGRSSYTSPYLCECYVPGFTQIRTGMITSLSITRGTSNAGWSVDGLPLGIDVSFTVTDMSSVMHVPVTERAGLFDDDNAFNDYMAVLAGLGIAEQVYPVEKLKRRLNYMYRDFESWSSPAHAANWFVGTMPGRLLSAISKTNASI